MNSEKIVPLKTCSNCYNCLISKDRNLYECWFEDYFFKVEPYQEACECYIDRIKAERELLAWQRATMPELFDENGEMWKDPYVLLEKMEEVEKRLNKGKKVVEIPKEPWVMPDEIYVEYKKIARILVDLWPIAVEKNPLKIRNFSRNRLDPDDWLQMNIKTALYMLRTGKDCEDIVIFLISDGENREYERDDFTTYSLIRQFFLNLDKDGGYEKFVEDAVWHVPDDKKDEFRHIFKHVRETR